jgi:hypothetical protein
MPNSNEANTTTPKLLCPFLEQPCIEKGCMMWIATERMMVNQTLGIQKKETAYVCAQADKTPVIVAVPVPAMHR